MDTRSKSDKVVLLCTITQSIHVVQLQPMDELSQPPGG